MVSGMSDKQARKRSGRDLQRQGIVAGVGGLVIFVMGLASDGSAPALLFLGVVFALIGLVAWGAGLVRGDD